MFNAGEISDHERHQTNAKSTPGVHPSLPPTTVTDTHRYHTSASLARFTIVPFNSSLSRLIFTVRHAGKHNKQSFEVLSRFHDLWLWNDQHIIIHLWKTTSIS